MACREHPTETHTLVVAETDKGKRLDRYLALMLEGVSRQRVKSLIKSAAVQVDGKPVEDPNAKVAPGHIIEVDLPELADALPEGEDIPLRIAFEDQHLIVVDKPAGLVTHPGPGNETGTLVNALIAHCGNSLSGIGGVKRPGIVHRLDKDTSGLLVVAKTDVAHQGLSAQFHAHGRDGRLKRNYIALVWGRLEQPSGTVDAPLGRSPTNRRKMAVVGEAAGRRAVTHYSIDATFPLESGGAVTSVRVSLETGRTHQIRVHMAHIGHPLLGDRLYGAGFKASERLLGPAACDALRAVDRQALHAALLGFIHPVTGEALEFEAPLPGDLGELIRCLA